MAVKPLHSYERFGVRTRHRGGERGAEQNRRVKASQEVGQAQPGIMFSWPAFLFGSLCATPKIRLEREYFSLL